MQLQPEQEAVLRAAIGRLLVPDAHAAQSDWRADLLRQIASQLQPDPAKAERFAGGLSSLAQESWSVFGYAFVDLPGGQQDELLARVENENVRTQWAACPPAEFVRLLVELTEAAARELERPPSGDAP